MKDTLESLAELSQRIRSLHRGPDKLVWPREFKKKVIQLHDQQNIHYKDISEATEVPPSTVYGWVKGRAKRKKKSTFKPIKVIKNKNSPLTVVIKKEITIEGFESSNIQSLLDLL